MGHVKVLVLKTFSPKKMVVKSMAPIEKFEKEIKITFESYAWVCW
jgi:hypothetical protein